MFVFTNNLNMNTTSVETEVCCPVFDKTQWDGKTHVWGKKLFIRDTIPEILHIPLPGTFNKAITRLWSKAEKAHAEPSEDKFLLLCYDPSPWQSVLLLSVTKEVPGADHVTLSGTFISKVFDGPYQNIPEFLKDMEMYLDGKKKKARQYYFHYTYCPKCAKKYGHNYVVIFAELEQ